MKTALIKLHGFVPQARIAITVDGATVMVDGAASSSPHGNVVRWAWLFGDGSPRVAGAQATYTYPRSGYYDVMLMVTDASGKIATAMARVKITVPEASPAVAFSSRLEGLRTSLSALASHSPGKKIMRYVWDFGDGTGSTGVSVVHKYAAAGTYNVKLTVTDNRGATASVTQPVTVAVALYPLFPIYPAEDLYPADTMYPQEA